MTTPPDDRAPLARAYQRASRGITAAVGMVLPGMLGYVLDSRIGTKPLFTIIGFGAGVTYGIWELVRMGRSNAKREDVGAEPADSGSHNDASEAETREPRS